MKKKLLITAGIVLAVIIAVLAGLFIASGFNKRTDVVLTDYSVNDDGTKMTMDVAVASSMGFVRAYKDTGGGVKPHYLHFYSAFGGLNSSLGAKNKFVLELESDDTEIYFYHGDGGYTLVLEKDKSTNKWVRPDGLYGISKTV